MKRRRHHKVSTFPPQIVAMVNDLLASGVTYEEISRRLRDAGHEIGRSSVARYGREYTVALEAARTTKDFVRTLVDETGMDPLEMEKGAVKMSLHMAVEALVKAQTLGDVDGLKVIKAIGQIAKASAHVEQVSLQQRKELEAKTRAAAKAVAEKARGAGLQDDIIQEIEEKVLGIFR